MEASEHFQTASMPYFLPLYSDLAHMSRMRHIGIRNGGRYRPSGFKAV